MTSSRHNDSTYQVLQEIAAELLSLPNKQASLLNPIVLSNNLSIDDIKKLLKKSMKGQAFQLSKNISLEMAEIITDLLHEESQLLVDAETPLTVLVNIAQNLNSLSRLVLPGSIDLNSGLETVKNLAPYIEILFTFDMPDDVCVALVKSLPRRCFLGVDSRMTPMSVKKLIENLGEGHGINLDPQTPKTVEEAIRLALPKGCWINQTVVSCMNKESGQTLLPAIPVQALVGMPESFDVSSSSNHVNGNASVPNFKL